MIYLNSRLSIISVQFAKMNDRHIIFLHMFLILTFIVISMSFCIGLANFIQIKLHLTEL